MNDNVSKRTIIVSDFTSLTPLNGLHRYQAMGELDGVDLALQVHIHERVFQKWDRELQRKVRRELPVAWALFRQRLVEDIQAGSLEDGRVYPFGIQGNPTPPYPLRDGKSTLPDFPIEIVVEIPHRRIGF